MKKTDVPMRYLSFSFLVLTLLAGPVGACWNAIDPAGYAWECPIILRGKIVAVAEAAPGGERSDDQASIKVLEVRKNELRDVPLKVGDIFTVRMISRNNRLRSSTDLNYPVGTEAVWLVQLTSREEFRIDCHPVQKQPVGAKLDVRVVERVIVKGGEKIETGRNTKKEWSAERKAHEARIELDRAKQMATAKEIREIAKELSQGEKVK